jgi:hypothetical protein
MAEKGEDLWVETLRKNREAGKRMRERLETPAPAPVPTPAPGTPCE